MFCPTHVWVGYCAFSDSSVDGTLQVVQIYFDTSTYDEIERDVKVPQFEKEALEM